MRDAAQQQPDGLVPVQVIADRRAGHDHHALALRRRGGRRPGRAMGAAAGAVAGRGRVADPVRVVAQPHQRRRPARGTGGGRGILPRLGIPTRATKVPTD